MQIQTILNRFEKYSSFVYGKCRLVEEGSTLEPVCSKCGQKGSIYDHQPTPRKFDFVPFWGIAVVFVYTMRRVNCRNCGVKIEQVPWAKRKSHMTTTYSWFLSQWAKLLSWSDTAKMFNTSWAKVCKSVEMAVDWGRARLTLSNITAIGVDEIKWHIGHKYLTVVYQIDEAAHRLIWVGERRKVKTLLKFFRWFGKERTAGLKYIASDMWKPYHKNARSQGIGGARTRAGLEKCPMASIETQRKPDHQARCEAVRVAEIQSQIDTGIPVETEFPDVLGISISDMGRKISGQLVHKNDEVQNRAHEKNSQNATQIPTSNFELVQGQRSDFSGGSGGLEQQIKTHHQKSVRFSDLQSRGNRPLSYTR